MLWPLGPQGSPSHCSRIWFAFNIRSRLCPRPYLIVSMPLSLHVVMACGVAFLRSLASRLGQTAGVLSDADEFQVECLGAAVTAFFDAKWADVLRSASVQSWPVLYCHASDGWSRVVSELRLVRCQDHFIRRSGRLRAEYNLERELLKSTDLQRGAMLLSPPRPMLHGKSGGTSFRLRWRVAA